ncbi:hypothetical protein ACFE04_024690 [Oxalis oulophora]
METKLSNPYTKPQVVVIPYPVQGHIGPFMKLSHKLALHDVGVIFLTTEFAYMQMTLSTIPAQSSLLEQEDYVRIVSVPDGVKSEDVRKDVVKFGGIVSKVLHEYLENLIVKTNQEQGGGDGKGKITCVIADSCFGWAAEVGDKMGIKKALFFTSSPGVLAQALHLPKLIEAGIINDDGSSTENRIQFSPDLPSITPSDFAWNCPGSKIMQRVIFEFYRSIHQTIKPFDCVICNWFHEFDPSAENLVPNLFTIGPLLSNGKPNGNLWTEDYSCLTWLNLQPTGSVIYAAFGSSTKFSQQQLEELSQGLKLAGKPFLFVVRSDLTNQSSTSYLNEFVKTAGTQGKIVQWAPQELVLSHRSIACFLTHCGWSSSLEAITLGVPQLCWPYYADQFSIKSSVCEEWKIGLCLEPNEDGIVTRHEIKRKIENFYSNDVIRDNVMKLKELAQRSIGEGGSSVRNLEEFVKLIKNV